MRPDGVQDESSEHEHQKEHSSYNGEAYNNRSTRKRTWASMARTGDWLSHASLVALVDITARLNDAAENYEECIRIAENSRHPISQLFRAKAFLESIRDRLDEYITIGKEHDTDVLLEYVEGLLKHADLITVWNRVALVQV